MVRWSAAAVVLLMASGCVATQDGGDGDPRTVTETASTGVTTSTSATTSTRPPVPVADAWDPGAWTNGTCPPMQQIMAPYFFHDLAVRDGGRIVVLRTGSASRYEVHAEGAEGTSFLAAAPGKVFAAKDPDLATGRVVLYDADLKEVRSVQVGEVGSLHVDQGTLYVGGLGKLTTLTLDLAVQDVLDLTGTAAGAKRIDYIAVQHRADGAVAYLVDDVVLPFRLYRVDASDPSDLEELGNHTIGSSSSPGPQWIDAEAKQWYVGTVFAGRGPDGVGYGETAQAIGLDGTPAEEAVNFHSGLTLEDGSVTESGFDILAGTWYLPGWALLQGNGSLRFSRITFQDGVPGHACDLHLGDAAGPAYLANDYSWFVATAGGRLWYIDHTRGPTIARTSTLPFDATGLAVLA